MKILPGMFAVGLLASTLYACQRQAVSPAQLFLPPSNLVARSVSSSQIDLSWNDNATNEVGFELQYASNADFTGATTFGFGPPNRTSLSHTGLGPIATLWYKIRAIGPGGSASAWSKPAAFATTAPDGVVATPTVVSSAIDVSWGTPTPANTNITGYTVRYSTAAGSCKDGLVDGRNSSTYTATGLVPSTTYNVSVKAEGGAYSSAFSAPAHATTSPDGLSGTRISPLFFGQNAWLPIQIGTHDPPYRGDLEELLCGTSYASEGALQEGGDCAPAEVQASGVKLMRYGGKGVDQYYDADESRAQYLTMVDNMRTNGIEPLLQVPYWDGDYSKEDAAALVRYINITHDRCVRYWTIANEPNHLVEFEDDPDKYGLDAAAIAEYFKEYVIAMRDVDPTIVIVGPDLDSYDHDIMTELLTGTGATAGSNICGSYLGADGNNHYYLDVVAFHTYPFPDKDDDGNIIPHTRQDVINAVDGFEAKLNDLKELVGLCNSTRPESVLKMAVTEINVEYDNDIAEGDTVDEHLPGVNAQSFLAGQYWADVMNVGMKNGLEFMAFWSVKEGDPQIGYIARDFTKLPTYYHYQMLAQNFRGVYAEARSLKVFGRDTANVKAFGAKDVDQIVVMLLNQNQVSLPLTYAVRLDPGPVTGNTALKVNIAAGLSRQYTSPAGEQLAAASTVMLVFNTAGDLVTRYVYGLSSGTAEPTEFGN